MVPVTPMAVAQTLPTYWKWLVMILLTVGFPFGAWMIGTAIVWATPPVYRSAVVVQVPELTGMGALEREADLIRTGSVGADAARSLQTGGIPVSSHDLKGSVSVVSQSGPNLIVVEAQGAGPEQAQRKAMAYAEAYEQHLLATGDGTAKPLSLVVDPASQIPVDASSERRIVLGIGGLALLGLLLAIPFLKVIERAIPVRVMPVP